MKINVFKCVVSISLFLAMTVSVLALSSQDVCTTKEGPAHWNGECRGGLAQGDGVARYEDDYIESIEGEMTDGVPNGNVTIRYSDGGYYQGEVVDGEFHGFGTLMEPWGEGYSGNWSNGRRDGEGEYITADSRRIAGVWNQDRLLGSWYADPNTGCRVWWRAEDDPVGELSWSGRCVNGMAHGYGRVAWASDEHDLPVVRSIDFAGVLDQGVIQGNANWSLRERYVNVTNTRNYDGEWLDGQRNGIGTETAETNSNESQSSIFVKERYEGGWKQDLYWGVGKYEKTHIGGGENNLAKIEEGDYAAGRLHGMGYRKEVRILPDELQLTEIDEGVFVGGELGGQGVKTSEVQSKEGRYFQRVEGNWGAQGMLSGIAEYEDGSVFQGAFVGFFPSPSRGHCEIPQERFSGPCEALSRDTSKYSGETCLVPAGKASPCLKVISSWVE